MATQPTAVNLPSQVPRVPGNLNVGQDYERKLLLLIAASLSQNKEVKDFAIVSNPKGIDKIDDVIVRISFKNSRKDIALFIQSKHTTSNKVLCLTLNNNGNNQSQKVEIKLEAYQKAFSDVITMMNNNIQTNATMRELLYGIDVKNYYVSIFTNMEKVYPKLQVEQFKEDHPIYFLDTRNCGEYHQFDYTNDAQFNTDFYKQLYVFLGQPNYKEIDDTIAQVLGEDPKRIQYLDKVIKNFMQRGSFCGVLTKHEFELKLCEVFVNYWMVVSKNVDVIIGKYTEIWTKIFAGEEIINLRDDKLAALLAYHYECVIRNEVDKNFDWQEGVTKLTETTKDCIQGKYSKTVTDLNDLLFLLWLKNKIPLAITSAYTPDILNFLQKFKTLKRRFVIFCSETLPELEKYKLKESVITYIREITDDTTLEAISNLEVSLQGRRPVALSDISGVSIETAVKGIYQDLPISQVLSWTENIQHIIGPQLRAPDHKYISRNFMNKANKKLTEESLLNLVHSGLSIITGEPGMGKSTALEALAYGYSPQNFVIYIKLRECLHDIENHALRQSIESDPISFFFDKMTEGNTDDKITQSIMENHRTSKRLCLFLDAFDEILPLHGRRISSLMGKILDKTDVPIFCSTRPHAENNITKRDGTVCFELLRFDNEQIEEYFKKTNTNRNIARHLQFSFLSNPLHLQMTSQIYADHKNHGKITIGEMYKMFIELKHKTYFNKMNLNQNVAYLSIVKSMQQHRELAMVEIFGDCVTSNRPIAEMLKDICDQNIGIVDVRNSKKSFQFVHRTFAEYFVADLLLYTDESVTNTNYFDNFYHVVWEGSTYRDIKDTIQELTRNFDLWIEARKHFCDGFLGWLKCRIFYRRVKGSTLVDSINTDYPTRSRLTEDDVDSCTKLLTAIHAENEEDVESNLSVPLLETFVGIVAFNLAITTGNEGIVKLLLDLRPKLVDEQDVNGNTGLHIACAFGFSSLAELLFEQGADFGARNNKDKTPLGMATVSGQWEIWKIKHIDEIRKSSGDDRPASSTKHFSNDLSEALLLASRKSQWEIVKQLLQYGVDPSTSDRAGWTPMHFAAGSGQREIIEMLLKIGFNINEKTSDLTISRDYSQWGSVRLLLENGADHAMSNYDAGTLLPYLAANNGDLDQLQRGFNLNETNGGMPHPIACLWPTWLFEHGADPTLSHESDWTILHYAARGGEIDLVKVLFERGLKVNEKTTSGDTMLTIACKFENWHIAKWLLDHGVNPTPSNEIGWTAIHFAARGGELEIIERLLIRGIKIDEKTNNSETPITIACEKSKWHIVKWLLDHNADPTLYDKDGWTLMHFAARARQLHIVKILMERGFSVNEKAKDGETPLSIVRRQGWTDMIEVMLEYDSDESRSY